MYSKRLLHIIILRGSLGADALLPSLISARLFRSGTHRLLLLVKALFSLSLVLTFILFFSCVLLNKASIHLSAQEQKKKREHLLPHLFF
jgi:hypothetical protein